MSHLLVYVCLPEDIAEEKVRAAACLPIEPHARTWERWEFGQICPAPGIEPGLFDTRCHSRIEDIAPAVLAVAPLDAVITLEGDYTDRFYARRALLELPVRTWIVAVDANH